MEPQNPQVLSQRKYLFVCDSQCVKVREEQRETLNLNFDELPELTDESPPLSPLQPLPGTRFFKFKPTILSVLFVFELYSYFWLASTSNDPLNSQNNQSNQNNFESNSNNESESKQQLAALLGNNFFIIFFFNVLISYRHWKQFFSKVQTLT